MNEYRDAEYASEGGEAELDPRVSAMQRVVDAEQLAQYASREVERKQKEAAIAHEELEQARDELNELLGLPHRGMNKPASINVSAKASQW